MGICFERHSFVAPVTLSADADVLRLDLPESERPQRRSSCAIGRYNEKRMGMYTSPLFEGRRDIHVGIDLGAPAGTPVWAFYAGRIHRMGVNASEGDYGPTLVTEHRLDGTALFALHGHLSLISLEGWKEGDAFGAGQQLGWLGTEEENGGWPPHLHFQLSYRRPEKADLPGVVSEEEREDALLMYPDPRLVLGPIY